MFPNFNRISGSAARASQGAVIPAAVAPKTNVRRLMRMIVFLRLADSETVVGCTRGLNAAWLTYRSFLLDGGAPKSLIMAIVC
jgi:hypothetical protein